MLDCDGQQNEQTNMDYDCVVEGGCVRTCHVLAG